MSETPVRHTSVAPADEGTGYGGTSDAPTVAVEEYTDTRTDVPVCDALGPPAYGVGRDGGTAVYGSGPPVHGDGDGKTLVSTLAPDPVFVVWTSPCLPNPYHVDHPVSPPVRYGTRTGDPHLTLHL